MRTRRGVLVAAPLFIPSRHGPAYSTTPNGVHCQRYWVTHPLRCVSQHQTSQDERTINEARGGGYLQMIS